MNGNWLSTSRSERRVGASKERKTIVKWAKTFLSIGFSAGLLAAGCGDDNPTGSPSKGDVIGEWLAESGLVFGLVEDGTFYMFAIIEGEGFEDTGAGTWNLEGDRLTLQYDNSKDEDLPSGTSVGTVSVSGRRLTLTTDCDTIAFDDDEFRELAQTECTADPTTVFDKTGI